MKFTNDRLVFTPENVKDKLMPHHRHNLSWTATGYGERIPTVHMVRHLGVWRRVYCRIFSNIGTLFIVMKGEATIVDFDTP